MPSEQEPHDFWDECPPGELSRMVQRLENAQRRKRTRDLFGVAVLSMLLVSGGVILFGTLSSSNTPQGYIYGGISCGECKSHFADYHDHLTGAALMADAKLSESMATHLADCGLCRSRFDRAYPGVLNAATRPALRRDFPALAISWNPTHY